MTTSGIITRGYGNTRSTIVTRGYGSIVTIVEEAIAAAIPRGRRIIMSGRSQYSRRPVNYRPNKHKPVDQFEEICVTVELTELCGEEVREPIMGELCKKFDSSGINVKVTSVDIIPGRTSKVEVRLIDVSSTLSEDFNVSASLKHI